MRCIRRPKKGDKKVASHAKCKAYDDQYKRLGTREGDIKLAKIRERKKLGLRSCQMY